MTTLTENQTLATLLTDIKAQLTVGQHTINDPAQLQTVFESIHSMIDGFGIPVIHEGEQQDFDAVQSSRLYDGLVDAMEKLTADQRLDIGIENGDIFVTLSSSDFADSEVEVILESGDNQSEQAMVNAIYQCFDDFQTNA